MISRLRLHSFVGLLCLFLLTTAQANAADDLAGKIETVINAPEYKHARWGILVVDSESGRTIYSHNADQLFAPASVTKLYSCAAALVGLGMDYSFETPVYRRGNLSEGRLQGDLILVASGDLTLGGRTTGNGKMVFKDHVH